MKTYEVVVRATVTKTLVVEGEDEQSAIELAHQLFTVECDGADEDYKEDTIDAKELK